MLLAVGVLILLGYTPSTAPGIHLLISSVGGIAGSNAMDRIRKRRSGR
jgi:hypothetical protein